MECPPEWNEVELAPPHGRSRVRERLWRDGWRGGTPCEPVLTHGDVYGFTAPEAGSYLFNLQAIGARDFGLFARSRCTATPPEPARGCDSGALRYNRMVRLSLEVGERVHLFVVGQELAETGIPYSLWVEGPTPVE